MKTIYCLLLLVCAIQANFFHITPPAPNWVNGTASGYVSQRYQRYLATANAYAYGCSATEVTINGVVMANAPDRSQHVWFEHGVPVIHIWCGEGMTNNTLQCPFSTGKLFGYGAMMLAEQERMFRWNEEMSIKWPELNNNGKEGITYADMMSNRAGFEIVTNPIPFNDTFVGSNMSQVFRALETSIPYYPKVRKPGCNDNRPHCFTYHYTYNPVNKWWWEAGAFKHFDPEHRTIDQFVQNSILRRMGGPEMEVHNGIAPDNVALNARVAPVTIGVIQPPSLQSDGANAYAQALYTFGSPQFLSAFNPLFLAESGAGPLYPNSPLGRASQFGSSNEFTNGWTLGMMMNYWSMGGSINGNSIWDEETLEVASQTVFEGYDFLQHVNLTFARGGFIKNFPTYTVSNNKRTIGHPGLAGSNCFADFDHEIGHCQISSVFNSGNKFRWLPFNAWNPVYTFYAGLGINLEEYSLTH